MMTSERLLYRNLSGKVRDTMELCLYNAVLGGGDLQGKAFSYENRLATWGDESAKRADWFEGELLPLCPVPSGGYRC
jgi:DUF1680 family protein